MSDKGDNPYIDEVYDHLRRNFGAGPTSHAPDIREKAERLTRNWFQGGHKGLADDISQALLEAHNAGRAEAMAMAVADEIAAFEVRTKSGEVIQVFASGRVEGVEADIIFNRIPQLISQAIASRSET